jgi:hypothetical protein
MPKQKPTLIQYYNDGWRTGYLVRRGYKWTRVKRILPKYSTRKRQYVRVATADTREVFS